MALLLLASSSALLGIEQCNIRAIDGFQKTVGYCPEKQGINSIGQYCGKSIAP
jgi:hypothetical protein